MSNRALLHARGGGRLGDIPQVEGLRPRSTAGAGRGGDIGNCQELPAPVLREQNCIFTESRVTQRRIMRKPGFNGEKEASNGRRSDLKSKLHPSVGISILQVGFAAVNLLLQGQRKGLRSPELPYPNLNSL